MGALDGPETVDLLARRIEVLERLRGGPDRKREVVEDLDCSRSTLDRAVRQLANAGLLERTPEGYVTTLAGRLAAERYRRFLADERAILATEPALAHLPPDVDLPTALLVGAEVDTADGAPHDLIDGHLAQIRRAERYRAVLPRLVDSRLPRLCRARASRETMDAALLVSAGYANRLGREFPALAAGLTESSRIDVGAVDPPPYGLALAGTGDGTTVTVLVYDGERLVATLRSDDPDAVAWAVDRFETLRAGADTADDRLTAEGSDRRKDVGLRETAMLSDAGFLAVDREYFARRVPNRPVACWRVGFDLADVYYGTPVERRVSGDGRTREAAEPDDPRSATEDLFERLRRTGDQVVLGPPGSGKSTLCRGVACRWVEAGAGAVLYRTAPAFGGIDRIGPLVEAVERDDGHTLVVVEDAAAEGVAGPLGDLLERYRGDPEVSVLLEARESEWSALAEAPDPRARTLTLGTVTEYRPPPIDEATCRRAIEAFADSTGRSVPLSAAELHDRVDAAAGIGELYLLAYHLVSASDPVPGTDAEEATGLDAEVSSIYGALTGDGEGPDLLGSDPGLPGEVGVLVAALTAAEVPVTPGVVHALAVDRAVENDADGPGRGPDRTDEPFRNVDRVLEWLEGRMLFERPDEAGYRTRHPYWAVRFLETALDRDERGVRALFERALNAAFALADDPARRERVGDWLGRPVDRFEDGASVETFVADVFDVAVEHSSLVPLFGTTHHTGIDLPASCDAETDLSCAAARFEGWYDHGALDRAVEQAELLRDAAEEATDVAAETRERYRARALRGLGEIAEDRGNPGRAREHFEEALSIVRDAGLDHDEISTRNALGWLATTVDEYDRAREHLQRALEIGDEDDPSRAVSTTVYYLGNLAWFRGDYETAEEYLRRARDLDRRLGDRQGEAVTLNALGLLANDREEYERAERYYRQSLKINRETGVRSEMAVTLSNLGNVLVEQGEFDAAEACFEQGLSTARDLGLGRNEGSLLGGFGRLERERGNYEQAVEYHRRQREIYAGVDYERGVATADRDLGDVARARGDLATAVEHYEASLDRFREVDVPGRALDLLERLADVEQRRGDRERALERCEAGVELAAEAGLDDRRRAFREREADLRGSPEE